MCWQRTLSLLAALCAIVQGRDPPMVKIPDQGIVAGKEVAISRAQRATVFLGIPFAVPPVGQQGRFKEPITDPLPNWSDIRNASMQAAACPQSIEALKEYEKIFGQVLLETIDTLEFSEDCLYLNVFIPDGTPPSEGWPVIVWFHSGNFSVGTTALWDGSALAVKQKVVVVVPAYRLNILGFYVVNEVSPGNYGLLDQVAALEWVSSKISVFGGDPDNVCIMGHGAGGISVGLHMLSPRSRGMFHRAIAMSGSALSMSAFLKEEDMQNYREYDFGCDTNPEDIHITCMRNLDGIGLSREAWNIVPWGPVVDNTSNPFLPKEPELILERGSFSKVDFMTGFAATEAAFEIAGKVNNAEQGIPYSKFQELIENEVHMEHPENPLSNDSCVVNVNHLIEAIMFYYTPSPPTLDPALLRQRYLDYTTEKLYGAGVYKTAIYVSQYSTSTYVYRFDYKPKKSLIDIPEWAKVPHGFELPFVWGMPYWPSLTQIIWNGADRKVADNVMNLWTNFAKFGNPIQSGVNFKWDIFKELSPGVMIIDRSFNMSDSTNFDHKAFEFWQTYYPSVIEASTVCCNMTQIGIQVYGSPTLTGILATIVGMHYVVTS